MHFSKLGIMRLQRLMDYRFLQCLFLCLPLVTTASRAIRADWNDVGAMSTGNRGTRTAGAGAGDGRAAGSGSSVGETVCMNFGLQRHLGSVPQGEILVQPFLDDPFCRDGLGPPLVLEVFYRLRGGSDLVGDWTRLQTISSGSLAIALICLIAVRNTASTALTSRFEPAS